MATQFLIIDSRISQHGVYSVLTESWQGVEKELSPGQLHANLNSQFRRSD